MTRPPVMRSASIVLVLGLASLLALVSCDSSGGGDGGGLRADTTPPLLTLSSPTDGSAVTFGSATTIKGTVSDGRGIDSVLLYDGEQLIGTAIVAESSTGDSGSRAWTLEWTPAERGLRTIRIVARDTSGNEAEVFVGITVGDYWFRDQDEDGFGDAGLSLISDTPPTGYAANSSDCDDTNSSIYPGAPDLPELAFIDSNCDGIDGDASLALFVSTSGSDTNAGTRETPLQTLSAAVVAAPGLGRTQILAALGTYSETDGLQIASSMGVFGGYDPLDWSRAELNETRITGTTQGVLVDAAGGVTLQLMAVEGAQGSGNSVYGIRVINDQMSPSRPWRLLPPMRALAPLESAPALARRGRMVWLEATVLRTRS